MDKIKTLILIVGACIAFAHVDAEAVSSSVPLQVHHQQPAFVERGTSVELIFSVPGINPQDVQEAYLFYRTDGDIAYNQKPAVLSSSKFRAVLGVHNKQATIAEYYFVVHLNNGEKITYPSNSSSEEPIRVDVVDQKKSERERRVEETGVDYTILSPDPGNTVSKKDVVVALTLFYDPAKIDTANTAFKMLVDGKDVTKQANASNYFYTYSPDDLSAGTHSATFLIQKTDTVLTVVEWEFRVLDPDISAGSRIEGNAGESWMPQGNVEISARNQRVGGFANDALSGNFRLSGQKGDISYSAYGLLTSQEDSRLQPQNRFGASLYIGDWLEFEAGHVYPVLNPLAIAGQRMQGVNAGFHFWNDALNLELLYGKLRRSVDNIYEESIEVEEQTLAGSQESLTSYSLGTREGGTYKRKVAGGRLGIGGSEKFNFGLNFLKVEDDTNSIGVIDDFNSLLEVNPDIANNLDSQQRQALQQSPRQLSVSGNPAPKGNFVAASDIETNLDNNRIQFKADAAVSLLNQDISEGTLTREEAEDLGLTLDEGTETLLDQLSWLIIINENMETLPIRFNTDGTADGAETYFPTSILATQSELGLSYFKNNLKIRYRWIGPSYNSLANTTVRKDVAGVSLTDRFRLLENRIYVTVGYEKLHDNVVDNKDATTNTTTYRGNISWYPLSPDLPRISFGLMKRNRDNGVALNNSLVAGISGIEESAAVQNINMQQGDTLLTANPRFSDTYQFTASLSQKFSLLGISHDANLNFSLLNTKDEVFKYGDAQSNSFSIRFVNRYPNSAFQTNVGFNINNTETASGLTDIQIMGATIGGEMFFLEDRISVDMSLAFTKNRSETTALLTDNNGTPQLTADDYYKSSGTPTVSESHSYIVGGGARYRLNERHSFVLNFRYSNVQNTLSSSQTFPNDHLLQARYIFNF